ncbi:hypothetical protein [Methylobacterium brachiatum]|uniref:hypothetical protein n=1 Tax=Methylobacterium brachiatum TaxID=269660 RepID=UPI001113E387|nr:hypothetical protein [Methylobacterium brachiatum]
MLDAAARRRALRAAGMDPADADNPWVTIAVIAPTDPNAPPVKRPPSSKTIARLREKAEAAARNAAAARALTAQVQPALRPPAGRLFGVDAAALLLRGPVGGIGTTTRIVRTLGPLAAGGRHPAAVLMAAGSWGDEEALREALVGLGPKLAAIGLRICRRKAGLRMAKARP